MNDDDLTKFTELNKRSRCIRCKRRADDMVTCERCFEFRYCSIQCLMDDREDHVQYCTIIGIKKGILAGVTDVERHKKVKERARCLNEDGSERDIETPLNKAEDDNGSRNVASERDQSQPGAWKARHRKNKKNKGKRNNKKSNGANSNKEKDNTGRINENKSVESLIKGGKFGGAVRVGRTVQSGESFGEGWWKPKSKTKYFLTGGSSQTAGSDKIEKQKYMDFYSDSEDETSDVQDTPWEPCKNSESFATSILEPTMEGASHGLTKSGGTGARDKQKFADIHKETENEKVSEKDKPKESVENSESSSASTSASTLEGAMSGLELVKVDSENTEEELRNNRGTQGSSTQGKCLYCKKEGFVLTCSRCKAAAYCDKKCQKSDYQQHKNKCRLKERFDTALSKVPLNLKFAINVTLRNFAPSPLLSDIPDHLSYMILGARYQVMVEIIGILPIFFVNAALVRDVTGQMCQVMFLENYYIHVTSNPWIPNMPMSLSRCLIPGNFILLLDAHWEHLFGVTRVIRIDDTDKVHFIFMN